MRGPLLRSASLEAGWPGHKKMDHKPHHLPAAALPVQLKLKSSVQIAEVVKPVSSFDKAAGAEYRFPG